MKEKEHQRTPNVIEALIVLAFTMLLICMSIFVWKVDVHIPIMIAAAFAGLFGFFVLKCPWANIAEGIVSGINMAMMSLLIMYTIGVVVGSWILSGVVPSMIYYGLSILSPGIFLLSTLLICSIVSLATGSSWGTSGTVGIALIGVSAGLGVPTPLTAGVIISGAYFGDKMSPLSDTTNLAPAVAGSDLFQHIKGMLWTTGPAYIVTAIICVLLGFGYRGGTLDTAKIDAIQAIMASEFHISPLGLIPPVLVIGLVVIKIPALPALMAGIAASVAMCLVKGVSLPDIINVLQWGYEPKLIGELVNAGSDSAAIASLLAANSLSGLSADMVGEVAGMLSELMKRGGLQSMNWTVSLSIVALAYGGIMEQCLFLQVLLEEVLKKVRTVGGLVFTTCLASLAGNLLLADQYMAIVLPGRMFKTAYEKQGLHARMLSRCLEDVGTITSVLVPWNSCGAFHANLFGVSTIAYAPYAFLNWLNPIVSVAITYLGIGIAWKGPDGKPVISKKKPEIA
jgi:NhaC family Na+:H+ antiporter